MSDFAKQQSAFRLASTNYGDDLQGVAAREMGDANRWHELVWLNNLTPPYLTDRPELSSATVLLNGSMIRIPAPAGVYSNSVEQGRVFERDIQLVNRKLVIDDGGDFAVVSGSKNLTQQLSHAINTPRGQLRRHPYYGCLVHRLLGRGISGPVFGMLGAEYVKSTLQSDYRISQVTNATAEVVGDTIRVVARAEAVSGEAVDVVTP